jgi:serine/threonine protein kinase
MAGLAAMHEVGIAHLDVKPSNAILRAGSADPVLVDFGLARRKVRPGCATLCYGAPEIWEATPGTARDLPAAASDVYAFGCFAYELLTGKTLFDGVSDVAIISQHITHDGAPAGVQRLARVPGLELLRAFLTPCLRKNPHERATIRQLRERFPAVREVLTNRPWPIAVD